MRWLLVLIVGMALIACGGDEETDPATTSAGSSDTSGASTLNAPGAAGTSASGSSLRFDGADLVEMGGLGTCGDGVLGDARQVIATASGDGDKFWMFQIFIHKYEGPGTYDVGNPGSSYDAAVTFGDGAGTLWQSSSEVGGIVTVNNDGNSGTIDTVIHSAGGQPDVHVTGSWVCNVS